ncbi:MAG TPA: nucleoside hydrolase [Bacteroidales bacterium]|nr:nucleoside hydrolase [Bacteroidales bacterium]
MKKTLLLFYLFLLTAGCYSHPWKPNHFVIIDTDGGIDDMRAITMLLASPDVRVLGIVVSPGALNVDSAFSKVRSLLYSFHHEGIPVSVNKICTFKSPDFEVALKTQWGKSVFIKGTIEEAPEMILDILENEKNPISFLCFGGMSTAAMMSKEPAFIAGVKEIIRSGEAVKGFNYQIDERSAVQVSSGKIPVKIINGSVKYFYNDVFLQKINQTHGEYSDCIIKSFTSELIKNHPYSFTATDEMIPVFLHFPELFRLNGNTFQQIDNTDGIRDSTIKILAGETVQKNQVIRYFPDDPDFYYDDIRVNVSEIINKYGKEEWVSGVIANELHRHLGTYAIIGVKMGIRAREYFNTGVDEFSAVSFAGSTPPLSCMNDGLQVSTGATPGHGLLTVRNENPSPSVEFTYMNHKIRLTLKPDLSAKINNELKEINFIYGLDSNIYWELVRKNTVKYWLELDRHEIFNIEVL